MRGRMVKAPVLLLLLVATLATPSRGDEPLPVVEPLDPAEWSDVPTRKGPAPCLRQAGALWNLGRVLRKQWVVLSVEYPQITRGNPVRLATGEMIPKVQYDRVVSGVHYGEIVGRSRNEILLRSADGTTHRIPKSGIDPWAARSIDSEADMLREYVSTLKPKTGIAISGAPGVRPTLGTLDQVEKDGIRFTIPSGAKIFVPFKRLSQRGIRSYSGTGPMVRDHIKDSFKVDSGITFHARMQTNKGVEEVLVEGKVAGIDDNDLWVATPDGPDMGYEYDSIVPGTIKTK